MKCQSPRKVVSGREAGLTLIELMIVMAIVSILGVVGTPLYQGYKLKTKVGSGVATMAPVKALANEFFAFNSRWPDDNEEAGAHDPSAYNTNFVSSITITDTPSAGSIVLTFDNTKLRALGNKNTLIYYPVVGRAGGSIVWKCDAGNMETRYRPGICRS